MFILSDDISKSWFCVFNNPTEHGYSGSPDNIVNQILDEWCYEHPTRSASATYCISADGLPHIHAVFEDVKAMRFSAIKKKFPSMHIEATKGNKKQAEDYINKRGSFAEKGEQIVYSNSIGEIQGAQGKRTDLTIIGELIEQGYTPNQIMDINFSFRRYETMIKSAFFHKRDTETPFIRNVTTYWHVGESGSGKTYVADTLIRGLGEENLYFVNDYHNGGMDLYNGQEVLFLDEFRGQIPYHTILSWLDCYKTQIHCRYANGRALWNEVHISTVLPPEKVYQNMVSENQDIDTLSQLFRRIDFIVYHWKDEKGYHVYPMPMSEYKDYADLKNRALGLYDFKVATYEQQQIFN